MRPLCYAEDNAGEDLADVVPSPRFPSRYTLDKFSRRGTYLQSPTSFLKVSNDFTVYDREAWLRCSKKLGSRRYDDKTIKRHSCLHLEDSDLPPSGTVNGLEKKRGGATHDPFICRA
jgi:hypothetical protein